MTDAPRKDAATARPAVTVEEARRSVARQARRTRRAMVLERLVGAVWPAWAVLATFLGLALAGAFEALGPTPHLVALAAFGPGFAAAAVHAVRSFRVPTTDEARALLDADAAERPVAALDDALAVGEGDAATRAVWAAHRRRMAARAAALKARAANLRLARRDRLAFRLSALVVLLAGLMVAGAGGDGRQRLETALTPGAGAATAAIAPSVEAWATPPAYTGEAMVYLTERAGETVSLPEGSRITLRVYSAPETPGLVQGITEETVAFADFGEGTWDLAMEAGGSGPLEVSVGGAPLARWDVTVAEDAAPVIAFAGEEGAEIRAAENGLGALEIPFRAEDDHGVVAAWATIELDLAALSDRDDLLPPPPGLETLEFALPLPFTGATDAVEDALIEDLTEHPWAGLPVKVTLHAEDGQGQVGTAGPVTGELPTRPFYEPMARAFLEERRT